jgi:hypothetical protein
MNILGTESGDMVACFLQEEGRFGEVVRESWPSCVRY